MVQFTHYIIFAKINGIFIKEPVVYTKPLQAGLYTMSTSIYALQNKHPQCRSAFTYCEDELPSCMNFGKRKYGSPFTIEQVKYNRHNSKLIRLISNHGNIINGCLILKILNSMSFILLGVGAYEFMCAHANPLLYERTNLWLYRWKCCNFSSN